MSSDRSISLVRVLVAVLVVQMLWVGGSSVYGARIVAIEVRKALPFQISGSIKSHALPKEKPCALAFACSSKCAFCSRLATRYVAELSRSTPDDLQPYWLITSDSTGAARWAERHGLPQDRVLALSPTRRTSFRGPRFGRLWYSPMRMVLADGFEVRDARPADGLLNRQQLDELCRQGGSVPQSIEELIAEAEASKGST